MTRTQQAAGQEDGYAPTMTHNPVDEVTNQSDTKLSHLDVNEKAIQQSLQHLERQVVNLVSCAIHEDKPLYLGDVSHDQTEELDILDDLLREYGFMLVWRKLSRSRKQKIHVFLEPVSIPKPAGYEGACVHEVRHDKPATAQPNSTLTSPETSD